MHQINGQTTDHQLCADTKSTAYSMQPVWETAFVPQYQIAVLCNGKVAWGVEHATKFSIIPRWTVLCIYRIYIYNWIDAYTACVWTTSISQNRNGTRIGRWKSHSTDTCDTENVRSFYDMPHTGSTSIHAPRTHIRIWNFGNMKKHNKL